MKTSLKWLSILLIGALFSNSCNKNDNYTDVATTELKCSSADFSTYITGDFHQHTTYTDGSWSFGYVMEKNNAYNLDWWANSEHGGAFSRDGAVSGNDLNATVLWTSYTPNPIIGKENGDNMWRWQCIRDYSFAQVKAARLTYPNKVIIQGLEWNVPGHEHASVAIITNQFDAIPNADPVAEFEYKFDSSDTDDEGGAAQGWVKSSQTDHQKTLEAIAWLQAYHQHKSWVIPAHPERKNLYSIADFRDMNNAGPDVCFGFESMPGHQKSSARGEYKSSSNTYGTCTYGGTGKMAAKVGGMWDAMLTEGRHWWLFANSDFHDIGNDFYPGEYQKTYVYVTTKGDAQAIVDGLRSGNSYVVCGDLIDSLKFSIGNAMMGQTHYVKHNSITMKIRVHTTLLNHIDIIGGKVRGKIASGDPKYDIDTVSTTSIVARFDAYGGITDTEGMVSRQWKDLGNGWKEMTFVVKNITDSRYYRLRGTNLGLNVTNETDGAGNPLADDLMSPNTADKALADLWFYSNPIWVRAK